MPASRADLVEWLKKEVRFFRARAERACPDERYWDKEKAQRLEEAADMLEADGERERFKPLNHVPPWAEGAPKSNAVVSIETVEDEPDEKAQREAPDPFFWPPDGDDWSLLNLQKDAHGSSPEDAAPACTCACPNAAFHVHRSDCPKFRAGGKQWERKP